LPHDVTVFPCQVPVMLTAGFSGARAAAPQACIAKNPNNSERHIDLMIVVAAFAFTGAAAALRT